jgi:hypothetical protein
MVWGVIQPGSFGDFYPFAEFTGWEEDLRKYYDEKMPAKQKDEFLAAGDAQLIGSGAYVQVVYKKFSTEIGTKIVGFPPTTAIEEHELPKTLNVERPYANLGSLISACGFWAADEAFKTIVERLEPDLHQFYPIQIIMPKGKVYSRQYYMMVIGQYLDSFSPDNCDEGAFDDRNNGYYTTRYGLKRDVGGMAFLQNTFGKAQMWSEHRLYSPEMIMSDVLQAEIIKAGLRLPKHFKMKEV